MYPSTNVCRHQGIILQVCPKFCNKGLLLGCWGWVAIVKRLCETPCDLRSMTLSALEPFHISQTHREAVCRGSADLARL